MSTRINNGVEILGRTKEVKQFLLSLLVMSRMHLAYRPISLANEIFYDNLSVQCDKLLHMLRTPYWPEIETEMEEGIKCIKYVADWPIGKDAKKERERKFKISFHRFFKGLDVPWSNLTPTKDLMLDRWPKPQNIFIMCGQNIGIGDELLFFSAAQRLAKKYPQSTIKVSSFHSTLWDSCHYVNERNYPIGNQLFPFVKAKESLEENPDNLVIFVEFASSFVYRNLESVKGFNRFVYIDAGSKIARLVDQDRSQIAETSVKYDVKIYETISRLLDGIGLDIGVREKHNELLRCKISKIRADSVKKIFINPLSSKYCETIDPEWWANIIKYVNRQVQIEVNIFAGINGFSWAFTKKIAEKLNDINCQLRLFGYNDVPTIHETIEMALACDLIIGLDTFTSHIGIIKKIPTITIFFDSSCYAWQSPDPQVLNSNIYDKADNIGMYAVLMSSAPDRDLLKMVRPFLSETDKAKNCIKESVVPDNLSCLFNAGHDILKKWSQKEPKLLNAFSDVPLNYITKAKNFLTNSKQHNNGGQIGNYLKSIVKIWEDSNFCRYLKYINSLN